VERTLVFLKPDAVTKRICGKVIARFEGEGFAIRACKMFRFTKELCREHYTHIAH
jgi:nucleoside-diphosphate kinase